MQVKFAYAVVLAAFATGAAAQAPPIAAPTSGVLSLSSSANVEVTKDVLSVVFSAAREGNEAQAVQTALKQALDAALGEARKVTKPGQVEVQTGNFALYPRYAAPVKGAAPVISGWQGTAELIVQGKDITAIAQLSGRIQTMTVASVGYSLSREAREKVEADVTAQAIVRWRASAAHMTRQFGYSSYVVREVNVSTNESHSPIQPMQLKAMRSASVADESLPTEAGKGDVTATVNGSAQMIK